MYAVCKTVGSIKIDETVVNKTIAIVFADSEFDQKKVKECSSIQSFIMQNIDPIIPDFSLDIESLVLMNFHFITKSIRPGKISDEEIFKQYNTLTIQPITTKIIQSALKNCIRHIQTELGDKDPTISNYIDLLASKNYAQNTLLKSESLEAVPGTNTKTIFLTPFIKPNLTIKSIRL